FGSGWPPARGAPPPFLAAPGAHAPPPAPGRMFGTQERGAGASAVAERALPMEAEPPASVRTPPVESAAPPPVEPAAASTGRPGRTDAAQPDASGLPAIPAAHDGATLVFVFDDGGQNMNQLERFVTLPFPITVAVLPRLAHSAEAAARVRASGNEVMLHQPMQAINRNVDPGPGAITPELSMDEIKAVLRQNIAEVGPVSGINNHEGSLISEDEARIGTVLQTVSGMGLYFLDSRTTSQTRVPQAAMALGLSYYERNIFLDNTKDRADIIAEIMKGLAVANRKGCAIMIGHVWSADVLPGILLELHPLLVRAGYRFATVSQSGALIEP
ncbi:MAG: divergent polysaccharide deacetylase family protein, partial [Treponemataceae bacterium]|nr:divergent polysaccharide deacetylase family protein [Treponemataceae bacterium]